MAPGRGAWDTVPGQPRTGTLIVVPFGGRRPRTCRLVQRIKRKHRACTCATATSSTTRTTRWLPYVTNPPEVEGSSGSMPHREALLVGAWARDSSES